MRLTCLHIGLRSLVRRRSLTRQAAVALLIGIKLRLEARHDIFHQLLWMLAGARKDAAFACLELQHLGQILIRNPNPSRGGLCSKPVFPLHLAPSAGCRRGPAQEVFMLLP